MMAVLEGLRAGHPSQLTDMTSCRCRAWARSSVEIDNTETSTWDFSVWHGSEQPRENSKRMYSNRSRWKLQGSFGPDTEVLECYFYHVVQARQVTEASSFSRKGIRLLWT